MLGGLLNREEIAYDEGHQICAHFYASIKVIIQETSWQLFSLQLKRDKCIFYPAEKFITIQDIQQQLNPCPPKAEIGSLVI